jgi:hypothetical protein
LKILLKSISLPHLDVCAYRVPEAITAIPGNDNDPILEPLPSLTHCPFLSNTYSYLQQPNVIVSCGDYTAREDSIEERTEL